MNPFIVAQINNMIAMTRTFEQSCKMAAVQNDGRVDRQEEKTLAKLSKLNENYRKELEKIRG